MHGGRITAESKCLDHKKKKMRTSQKRKSEAAYNEERFHAEKKKHPFAGREKL